MTNVEDGWVREKPGTRGEATDSVDLIAGGIYGRCREQLRTPGKYASFY